MYKDNNLGLTVKILSGMMRDYACGQTKEKPDRNRMMQGWIIDYLYSHRDRTVYQKEVESNFHQPKSTIATILKKMEQDGIICRIPDEKDTRLKKVTLSEKGMEQHLQMLEHFKRLDEAMCQGISKEEMDTFFNVADQIMANLENMQKGKE